MSVYELHISGTERYAKLSSFRAELQLNGHDNIIAFILPTEGSPEVRFDIDDEVELLKDSSPIAAGIVTNVGEEMEPEGGPNNNGRFLSRITASGWGEIASRRHVSLTVVGGSPGTSLSSVLTTLIGMTDGLGDDGVTLHPSQDTGPTVSAMVFEDTLPNEILNTLARDTGRVWRVDEQKRLRMWAKGDNLAAFDIDEDDLPAKYYGDIRPTRSRFEGYANRVIVKGTVQTILEYAQNFTSTGSETTFAADHTILGVQFIAVKITNVPSLGVALDSALWENLGPVGSGHDWDYDIEAGTFTRVAGALPSGAEIRIWYDAEVTPRGVANDLTDQDTSPVRDEVVFAPVTTEADAQILADQILPYFVGAKETKATYSTRETDLILPGDAQTMTVSDRGLSGVFLVERVVLRSGPGEMNTYLVQDIENTQNAVLKGDWRDLLNQFTVGPSGNTTRGGGGDTGGDTITNPDGDGGSGTNMAIPPDDTDIIINKKGALGTVRTYRGHAQIRYQDDAAVIAGGSPDEVSRMSMVLTALSTTPKDALQKWQSTTGGSPDTPDGVATMNVWESVYPGELIFGAELVEDVYIARSPSVLIISIDMSGNAFAALSMFRGQTLGDPLDLSDVLQLNLNDDTSSPWSGGLAGVGATARPVLWQSDAIAVRDNLGVGDWGLGILASDTFTNHRQLRINMGDTQRTINFDVTGFVKWT